MPKYVIEREMPGAGGLTERELKAMAQKSRRTLERMGPRIQWVHSYVTGDRIYCVYIAPDEAMLRAHAEQAGFPATRISTVATIIDPATAD